MSDCTYTSLSLMHLFAFFVGLLAVIGCIAGLSGLMLLVITGLFIRR